jgi:hypothetical protein
MYIYMYLCIYVFVRLCETRRFLNENIVGIVEEYKLNHRVLIQRLLMSEYT